MAQAEVEIGAAFAGVSAAAIHLRVEFAAVRQLNGRRGAKRGPAVKVGSRVPRTRAEIRRRFV